MNEEDTRKVVIGEVADSIRRLAVLIDELNSGDTPEPYDVYILTTNAVDSLNRVHKNLMRAGLSSLGE